MCIKIIQTYINHHFTTVLATYIHVWPTNCRLSYYFLYIHGYSYQHWQQPESTFISLSLHEIRFEIPSLFVIFVTIFITLWEFLPFHQWLITVNPHLWKQLTLPTVLGHWDVRGSSKPSLLSHPTTPEPGCWWELDHNASWGAHHLHRNNTALKICIHNHLLFLCQISNLKCYHIKSTSSRYTRHLWLQWR